MKRILAITLTLAMLLAALTGCVAEDITGTITFYSEATLEKNEPVSDTSFELSKEQVKAIKKIIKNVKDWTDDCVVDRLPLYFDGEIKFSDSEFVYYFSYDSRVIYYDHYFSVISDDEMQEIKDIRKGKEGEQNPQKFKLSITGDYADNILTELEDSYLAGETITFQLETITEHYYVVTMNGITLPQAESSLEYTWFGFRMPEEDVVISITQKGVDIPPPPADSDDITFQYGDILSQVVLDNAQKETVQELLADKHNWIDEMPEIVVNGYFTGFEVKAGYCINSGMLIDYISNRSRKLTAEEKAFVESLISMLEEPTHSGYEVEIKLLQYTWDGWGISTKTVGACDVAYNIIDALKAMKETGETVPMISDEVFEIGGGQYAAERGTMWIESGNKIYRLTPDLSQICLVETHFGEGKVLEITDAFKTNVNNAWHYAPYDYYKGTYNKGDYTVDLESVFKSGSTVQLSIRKIQIESGYDPKNTITVELISSVDQEVNIKLHCQQSDDNLAAGDYRTVQLKKGEPTTVDLTFGGWANFTYWVYIEADLTKAEITINPQGASKL